MRVDSRHVVLRVEEKFTGRFHTRWFDQELLAGFANRTLEWRLAGLDAATGTIDLAGAEPRFLRMSKTSSSRCTNINVAICCGVQRSQSISSTFIRWAPGVRQEDTG
ncbi:MAG: hypothetical protein U5O39_06335 [Gammaproteobacteria bacterium]|nr:hypothetical protein [Gammaproteobacteria bacterium]